jgi:hypothetical protein
MFAYKVINIEWDTDGEDISLPEELSVIVPKDLLDSPEELDQFISDDISNQTGFCHKGYNTVPEIKY